jgi:hypothetical protein
LRQGTLEAAHGSASGSNDDDVLHDNLLRQARPRKRSPVR